MCASYWSLLLKKSSVCYIPQVTGSCGGPGFPGDLSWLIERSQSPSCTYGIVGAFECANLVIRTFQSPLLPLLMDLCMMSRAVMLSCVGTTSLHLYTRNGNEKKTFEKGAWLIFDAVGCCAIRQTGQHEVNTESNHSYTFVFAHSKHKKNPTLLLLTQLLNSGDFIYVNGHFCICFLFLPCKVFYSYTLLIFFIMCHYFFYFAKLSQTKYSKTYFAYRRF